MSHDAVVVGAGPNGLVAANVLADEGWRVLVLDEQGEPGGAVRSGEVTEPGFVHDLYSAFYPLAAASKYIRELGLEAHGLRWRRSHTVVAHPHPDGRCAEIALDIDQTAASVEAFAPGDGDAWRQFMERWRQVGPHLIDGLMTPMPPIRAGARIARAVGVRNLPAFARFAILPARRMANETYRGEGGGWLLAGNALHADLTPDSLGGGLFGWVLCGLAQEHGFPTPEGGAGELTRALVRRLRSRGGELRCGVAVERFEVRDGRATAAIAADGERFAAGRAILADVGAPALYRDMLPAEAVPSRVRAAIDGFEYDNATVKVNWALREPIPWSAEGARRAGVVHVAEGMDGLSRSASQLTRGLIPDRPFLVLGQYDPVDRTRFPEGSEAAWGYTHVPQAITGDAAGELQGNWDEDEARRFAERMEAEVERLAPGFTKLIARRHVQMPADLERANRNLVGGAINGGTAQLHQQLLFRPIPGLGRPTTPVSGLYLASASAHPGGGVHGGPGGNAARVALRKEGLRRVGVRGWRSLTERESKRG